MDSDLHYEHPYGVTKFPNYRSDIDCEDVGSISVKCNPKDVQGSKKVGVHCIPPNVITAMALALTEGEIKYTGFNWREHSIHYSAYYDAVMRHMFQWYNGEDIDPDSGLPHVVKAMATLAVLIDAMHNSKVIDDRPMPISNPNWMQDMNHQHNVLVALAKDVLESKKC